jgi:SAM-dependent methyltransferase
MTKMSRSADRKPFQGVMSIISFNRHYYFLALFLVLILVSASIFSDTYQTLFIVLGALTFLAAAIPVVASWYIYDYAPLYSFPWLCNFDLNEMSVLNVNAGFDETTTLLKAKFPAAEITVYDFYNAKKHTEKSIQIAREKYPPFPGTVLVNTTRLPAADNAFDYIVVTLAAHEIRDAAERTAFFSELKRVLKSDGKIFVTEHLRDSWNFAAFNIGFFHFHSKKSWLSTFTAAGLEVEEEHKATLFITTFILKKNGNTL